jgi:hypothetical protein
VLNSERTVALCAESALRRLARASSSARTLAVNDAVAALLMVPFLLDAAFAVPSREEDLVPFAVSPLSPPFASSFLRFFLPPAFFSECARPWALRASWRF